ncbi:uracil-DNA glycosylase [Candidatus Pelagibacter sp.]|nr:uracil-DNA glycosylase [Candidatus Pelagibacter sp.]
MTKKSFNQNAKHIQQLEDMIEPNFIFGNKSLNRLMTIDKTIDNKTIDNKSEISNKNQTKLEQIFKLKQKINSIENCNLKNNSKNIIIGDGNINSSIMLIGETPGKLEDQSGKSFQGAVGELLKKMLSAINIKKEEIYLTYSINFRPPDDRKPTSQEIKRYSIFLKEHITIINPKIIILMGSTAMEAITGLSNKISNERGNWREIILKNMTYPIMITFSPSYLIRFPENKKYSWEDLKKIRKKIQNLNINI